MVSVGILLFVAGFLVTLAAMEGERVTASGNEVLTDDSEDGSSARTSILLTAGILVSLVGVVLATVGPAVGIVRGKG